MEDGTGGGGIIHFVNSFYGSLEAACHIDAVVAVADFGIECRQIIFLCDDGSRDGIESIFDPSHKKLLYHSILLADCAAFF